MDGSISIVDGHQRFEFLKKFLIFISFFLLRMRNYDLNRAMRRRCQISSFAEWTDWFIIPKLFLSKKMINLSPLLIINLAMGKKLIYETKI